MDGGLDVRPLRRAVCALCTWKAGLSDEELISEGLILGIN